MNDLFGPEGRAAITRLARLRTLYAFDFDGTLAPIVDRPDAAQASDASVRLLARLAQRVPTALLSGRGVGDLRQRIAFTPRHLVGNHGAEGLPSATRDHAGHEAIVANWRRHWPGLEEEGITVETKQLSLSIHYRAAPDHARAMRVAREAMSALVPQPRVIGGKCVFNLLPEGAPDKGGALASLVAVEHCEAAFFIGDDITDEAAFVGAPAHWVTVHVGTDDDSAARYRITAQADIEQCLALLVDAVERAAG